MLDNANPFGYVGAGVDSSSGISIEYFHRVKPNPLITQQDAASSFVQLSKNFPVERRSRLFERLANTSIESLERILCGPASALTCLRSIQSEDGVDPTEMVNSTHITALLSELCRLDGVWSTNPLNSLPLENGWQVFSRVNDDIGKWEIYHHALAYGIDQLSNGLTTTTGIKGFTIDDLANLSARGSKIIISVSNSIVSDKQINQLSGRRLHEGSHLVAIVGADANLKHVYLADPYVEAFSDYDTDPVPRLVLFDSLERLLRPVEARRGLVLSRIGSIPSDLLKHIEYPLAKPNT